MATATVVVNSSTAVVVKVSPEQVNLAPNGTASFTSRVQGSANTTVIWNCSGGTIDSTGAFTAPTIGGTYTVTATSQADASAIGTATVTVIGSTGMTTAYQYDLNGNMTSDGLRTFEWDAENRLVAVTIIATGHRSEFGYDGIGRRVQIRELDKDASQNLQVTSDDKYFWDGMEIAEKRTADGGTVIQRFFKQGFVDTDGTILFYSKDHLGSIRELTDLAQVVRARYEYDPFGQMTKVAGDRESSFTYTGYFWHAQTGLNLAPFREFDPRLGRWTSRDPIGEFGGINLYAYVENQSIGNIDLLGLCPGDCTQPVVVYNHPLMTQHILIGPKGARNYFTLMVYSYDPCTKTVYYELIREFPGAWGVPLK